MLHLVRTTIVTALAGVQDVGAEIGTAAVAAVRGSIKAAHSIGGDLGAVARESIRGTVVAAASIGGELGGVARSASRGAVKATGDVGGDVATAARRAVEGTALAAKELGVDVRTLAQSAAEGAMEAADRIGGAGSRAVRATLSGTVAGMRSLVATVAPSAHPRRPPRASGKRSRAKHSRKVTQGWVIAVNREEIVVTKPEDGASTARTCRTTAVCAAGALSVGVLHLTERTGRGIARRRGHRQRVGSAVRAARGSIKAAEIGGDPFRSARVCRAASPSRARAARSPACLSCGAERPRRPARSRPACRAPARPLSRGRRAPLPEADPRRAC